MMPELPVVAMPRNTPQPLKAVFPYPDTITKTPSNEILHAMFMRERISAIFDTWSSRVVDTFSEGVGLSLSLPEDSLISPSLPETLGSDPKCSDAGSLALLSGVPLICERLASPSSLFLLCSLLLSLLSSLTEQREAVYCCFKDGWRALGKR